MTAFTRSVYVGGAFHSFLYGGGGFLQAGVCSAADGVVRSRGDSEAPMEHSTVINGGDGTPSLGSGNRQDMKEKTSRVTDHYQEKSMVECCVIF